MRHFCYAVPAEKDEEMKKTFMKIGFCALTGMLLALSSIPSYAIVRHIDLEADLDNIPEHSAGEAFLPEYILSDDNDDISIDFGNLPETTVNPTIPYNYEITVHSDSEALDEDLEIRGTGIRATYVDYVSEDNAEAVGRLQVYPFYRLPAPAPVIDYGSKTADWAAVPYAGKYEYLISYTTKNGDEKLKHGTTKQTYVSVASELAADADGVIGVAVRALATEEEGYAAAKIVNGTAFWEDMDWADKYRVRIAFTNLSGKTVSQEKTVTGNSLSVQNYITSSADGAVRVTVRAIPGGNDHAYYNIALSEFGFAGTSVDTGDYEVDDPWEFLSDYTAVVDGNFASRVPTGASSGQTGISSGPAGGNGSWKRVTYRWQYLINGVPFNGGWLKIGNAWYYFGSDGYMYTGWLADTDGRTYYLETKVGSGQGQMITGEREINGVSHFFDQSGAMVR